MELQHQALSQLLKALFQNNIYEKAILQAGRKYKIRHYRIQKLKPSGIKNLLRKNPKKQKTINLQQNNYAWAEGQLKIFVWLLVGYVYVRKIDISDMNESDFYLFSQIFQGYTPQFLHYQAKFLIRSPQKVNWTQQQARLLNQIIKAKFQQKNWNTVAYELYLISQGRVFRTPKQCRQRWLNHQDPVKNHSQWTIDQDLQLLRFVKIMGKKWSLISKSMKSTRTEHMVKNRFTSLLRKATKGNRITSEKQLIDILLKLKKAEKELQANQQIEQQVSIEQVKIEQPEIQIELKQIQHTEQQNQCKKQSLKQSQYFAPMNLIPEKDQEQQPATQQAIHQQIVNFFEQDNSYNPERYSDAFFTVPQPTKQIC